MLTEDQRNAQAIDDMAHKPAKKAVAMRKPAMLTVSQATNQARRHVNKIMPGVMATVESKLSHDLATDTPTVITTVTFPRQAGGEVARLSAHLATLAGRTNLVAADSSIVITRAR